MFKFLKKLFGTKPPMLKHAAAIKSGEVDCVTLEAGSPPGVLMPKGQETQPLARPACTGYTAAHPLASLETARTSVLGMISDYARRAHRNPTVLVCNNVTLCELKKWLGPLDAWNDPSTWPAFCGLKIVSTPGVVGSSGFLVAG